MNRRLEAGWKRITSGFLAFTIVSILILGNSGIAFAEEYDDRFYREETDLSELGEFSKATVSNASFKNSKKDDVVISILSEEGDYRPGGLVTLDVHLKNETGTVVTDGSLTYSAKGIQEGSAEFSLLEESGEDAFDTGIVDDGAPDNGMADDSALDSGIADDGTEGLERIEGIELVPGQIYSVRFTFVIDEDIEGVRSQQVKFQFDGKGEEKRIRVRENFLYTVNYLNIDPVEFQDGNRIGTGEMVTMGIHASMFDFDAILEDSFKDETDIAPATPSEATPAVPLATPSEARPATPSQARPDIPSKPAPETPEEGAGIPQETEPQEPADTGESQIQTSIETLPTAAEEAPANPEETETQVSAESSPADTGENQTQAATETEPADSEETTIQASAEAEPTEAADTEAAPTMSSEPVQEDSTEAEVTDQDQSEEMESESVVVIESKAEDSSNEHKGTTAEDTRETQKDADEEESEDYTVDLGKVNYRIEMYNAKLNSFKVRKAMVDDVRENMLICSFRVSGDVNPGIYFGKITQESRIKGKTCKSTQGFSLIVTGDGEISLEGRIGDAAVTVSGPVDSFPEADQLAVSVSEVEQDQMAQVDEALVKKSQEEGLSIQSYKALDIKLYADGAEVEPVGPINVAFKNLELEKRNPAAASNAQADVPAAAQVLPRQEEPADSSERLQSGGEEIKVYHLDETQAVANEMNSTVASDGTVVMETDHFSIYIVVNVPEVKEVPVTVEHWAQLDKMTFDSNGKIKESVSGNRLYPGAQSGSTMQSRR